MPEIEYFKCLRKSKRFNENQKVWIICNFANFLWIRYKYRGKGRYVNGEIDKYSNIVGPIKKIIVDKDFYKRIMKSVKY